LLREDSLEKAVANYPDVDKIPSQNIELMNSLSQGQLKNIMQICKDK